MILGVPILKHFRVLHLFDVNTVVGHGAVLAGLLLTVYQSYNGWVIMKDCVHIRTSFTIEKILASRRSQI